jgi:hypothetical protein
LISSPKELLIVVDRFDKKGILRHLLPKVPKELDLGKYLNKEAENENTISKFEITGFICQDPLHRDYSVYLRDTKKKGICYQWTLFNRRQRKKV